MTRSGSRFLEPVDRLKRALATSLVCVAVAWAGPASAAPDPSPDGRFGLKMVEHGDVHRTTRSTDRLPERVVVLVHGLDDTSAVWRDLVPALKASGHAVAVMDYPNDGPIRASAELLAEHLRRLHARGVRRIDIVAHSMGGLLTREVLSQPDLYDGDGSGTDDLPAVDHVVMLGTPNQGAPLARLRQVGALKERLIGSFTSSTGWTSKDGSGEAASDLLPGSRFLERLNGKPAPTHTRFTIVAGRLSPWSEADVHRCMVGTRGATPRWIRCCGRETAACMVRLIRGLGDGVVPIDAVRWPPVSDFVIVEASHVGMVRRSSRSDPPPPAIPLILDRLGTRLSAP